MRVISYAAARIFDNISQQLLSALRATLETTSHSDLCVGYFNLRGWKALDDLIEAWNARQGQMYQVLIKMHALLTNKSGSCIRFGRTVQW